MKKFIVAAMILVAFSLCNSVSYAQSETVKIELVKNSSTSTFKQAPSAENGDKKTKYTVEIDGVELPIWVNRNGTPFLWRQGKNGGYRYYFKGEQKVQVYKLLNE